MKNSSDKIIIFALILMLSAPANSFALMGQFEQKEINSQVQNSQLKTQSQLIARLGSRGGGGFRERSSDRIENRGDRDFGSGGFAYPGNNTFERNDVNIDRNRDRNFDVNKEVNINNTNVNRVGNNNHHINPPPPPPPPHPDWHYHHYWNNGYYRGFWDGCHYNYPWGVALGTALVTIPTTAILCSMANSSSPEVVNNYYYDDGVYYEKTQSGYNVVSAPVGVQVPSMPDGAFPLVIGNQKYFYYFGAYYVLNDSSNKYVVVKPPIGAVVPYVPDGYTEEQIGGQTYLKIQNTYYLPQEDDEGGTVFKVTRI